MVDMAGTLKIPWSFCFLLISDPTTGCLPFAAQGAQPGADLQNPRLRSFLKKNGPNTPCHACLLVCLVFKQLTEVHGEAADQLVKLGEPPSLQDEEVLQPVASPHSLGNVRAVPRVGSKPCRSLVRLRRRTEHGRRGATRPAEVTHGRPVGDALDG